MRDEVLISIGRSENEEVRCRVFRMCGQQDLVCNFFMILKRQGIKITEVECVGLHIDVHIYA